MATISEVENTEDDGGGGDDMLSPIETPQPSGQPTMQVTFSTEKRNSVVEYNDNESHSQSQSVEPPKVVVHHTNNNSFNSSNNGYGSSNLGGHGRRTSSSGVPHGLSLRDRQASSPKMLTSDAFHNKDFEVVSQIARKYSTHGGRPPVCLLF